MTEKTEQAEINQHTTFRRPKLFEPTVIEGSFVAPPKRVKVRETGTSNAVTVPKEYEKYGFWKGTAIDVQLFRPRGLVGEKSVFMFVRFPLFDRFLEKKTKKEEREE